jgi:glycosyltransferase involved in cell wall biosynthesis
LYLSLTGMTEPLGRSQVLEYLVDLSRTRRIHLISFERTGHVQAIGAVEKIMKAHQIDWHYQFYSNRHGIFSTIIQIVSAVWMGARIIRNHRIGVIHARSFIPAIAGQILKKRYGTRLLYDIRGFTVEEMVDRERIRSGSLLYRLLKKIEGLLYRNSDHIVTLTQKSKQILENLLRNGTAITVIPTCANKEIFRPSGEDEKNRLKSELGFQRHENILIHTGTISNRYDFDAEIRFFKALQQLKPDFRFLVVNQGEEALIEKRFAKHRVDPLNYKIVASPYDEMPRLLNIADLSVFFIPPTEAKAAMAPTKFAENIACHLPVITNSGVGDMEEYFNRYRVGLLLSWQDLGNHCGETAARLVPMLGQNPDQFDFDRLFREHFDKDIAVKEYNEIYRTI